ncbi:fimbrillin family protein [Streptomyces sp. NPDC007346]|uniref:fimbrillin family protein n=1 Tax=Streptomyces sp. NPDC007346 TaxID=3154682 RepID=UPI003452E735
MRRTGTTRRGALTATGALALGAVLTGCGGDEETEGRRGPVRTEAEAVRVERKLRTAAARTGASTLAHYDLVAEVHPGLAQGLAPLRAAVREHTRVLSAGGGKAAVPPAPGPVPADAEAAVKELAAAERRRADAHAEALLTAEPELARLLASVAAAAAAHAYLLTELAKETSP